jgi:hypothetical protein
MASKAEGFEVEGFPAGVPAQQKRQCAKIACLGKVCGGWCAAARDFETAEPMTPRFGR